MTVSWSITCYRTLNVPFDMLVGATRGNTQALQDCEALALISARRNRKFLSQGGGVATAIFFFVLTGTGLLGFVYNQELAQGLFLFLMPMLLITLLAARLSFRIEAENLRGEALCKALLRRRFWNQVMGIFVMGVAMVLMVISIATKTVYWL